MEAHLKLDQPKRRCRGGSAAGEQWPHFAEKAVRREAEVANDVSRNLDELVPDQFAGADLACTRTFLGAEGHQPDLDRLPGDAPARRRRPCHLR